MKKKYFFLILFIIFLVFFGFYSQFKINEKNKNIKIVAVATMRGIDAGVETINGIKLALKENNYRAGDYSLELLVRDDGDESGLWKAGLEYKIAQEASGDKDVLAYLGPIDSGATKISLPITNMAGLVQISSINTWPGLTLPGFAPGEPGVFYPNGSRNYFRVCPTDDLQGPAGAVWALEIGFKKVLIIDDGGLYGGGVANIFKRKAINLGMEILDHVSISRDSEDLDHIVSLVNDLDPDLIYFGGTTSIGVISLVNSVFENSKKLSFMSTDGLMDNFFIEQTGNKSEGFYFTSVGFPIENMKNKEAQVFFDSYLQEYGTKPSIYSGLAYESAKVLIFAINRIESKNRAEVIEKILAIKDFSGIFGVWSFDKNGDTNLKLLSGHVIKDGEFVFREVLK